MDSKSILLVDDEPGILAILKKSLEKLDQPYEVATALNGKEALTLLEDRAFDLVVTDYKMAGMNGMELLERIRNVQPETRVVMVTAYGNDDLESQARRMQAYEYLTKPLEIDSFRQVVQQALGDLAISQPGLLVLSDERYRKVDTLLAKLERDIGASGVLLVNTSGQIILKRGDIDQLPVEEIVTLLSGGIATLAAAGQALDGFENAVNLAYREGKDYDLYGLNIGLSLLLIMLISRSQYSSPLGSVWYYARRAADRLGETIGDSDRTQMTQLFEDDFEQELEEELDDMFGLDDDFGMDTATETSGETVPADVAEQLLADLGVDLQQAENTGNPDNHEARVSPQREITNSDSDKNDDEKLFSFQDAIRFGLLPPDVVNEADDKEEGENHADE